MTMDTITDPNCIIRGFQDINIVILSEIVNERPVYWFRASDLEKMLDLSNIRASVQNYTEKEKGVKEIDTIKGKQSATFLTSRGVYRLLYSSKKQVAVQFREWVGDLLDDIFFNQGKELQKQIKAYQDKLFDTQLEYCNDRHAMLLDAFDQKPVVYVADVGDNMVKYGMTDNLRSRCGEHKRNYKSFTLLYAIECTRNKLLESTLKKEYSILERRVSLNVNGVMSTEVIQLDDVFSINHLKQLIKQLKKRIEKESTYEEEIMMQEMKIKQLQLEIELEKVKQGIVTDQATTEMIEQPPQDDPQQPQDDHSVQHTKELIPIPPMAESIENFVNFYSQWSTSMRSSYKAHKETHKRFQWKRAFGNALAKKMCLRYHYAIDFLQFMDSLDDDNRITAFQIFSDFCIEHNVSHNNLVRVVFHHMCLKEGCIKAGFEGMPEKLHHKLVQASLSQFVSAREKQIQNKSANADTQM